MGIIPCRVHEEQAGSQPGGYRKKGRFIMERCNGDRRSVFPAQRPVVSETIAITDRENSPFYISRRDIIERMLPGILPVNGAICPAWALRISEFHQSAHLILGNPHAYASRFS